MEKIYTAKTEEAAREQAIGEFKALGIEESDILFEVIERPVKKLFGTKGEYRVKATAEEPEKATEPKGEALAAKAPADRADQKEAASFSFDEPEQKLTKTDHTPDEAEILGSEKVKSAVRYMTKVLTALGAENFHIETALKDGTVFLDIVGEKLGVVIGRRGETLDALQYLTILASNKAEESYCRISVDCNGYRAKRKETLEQLAEKISYRVLKQGRRITLEPMNPYERRIIHSKVMEIDGVYSNSVGEEPFRKVVISATRPPYNPEGRGRGRDRDRDRRSSSAGRSYRQSTGYSTSFEREYKRTPSEPITYSQETVDTEKNASLYGKIEL
ncbi:MAG: KH domain-containing protein [Bacteroides sp.]|nr:KH domain-containing protein [Eubacterium sp.]MCM1418493.1 KH domain-containing protein [Roseburia sp.]MCM1462512.1 KH domain-containing protein [Bacteroides sp.]